MAINVKANERLIQVGKYAGTYRYLLSAERYNTLSQTKVISEAALRSGLQKSTLQQAWEAIGNVISAWATEGHSVAIPGVGTMRFSLKATSVSTVEKVSSDLITARKVVFTPSVAIKTELKSTPVNIACYDRNGKLVRTVNSKGDNVGDFELELLSSPEQGGTLEGAGFYNEGDLVTIKATPAEGYLFVKWSDDETDAERTLQIGEDTSLVATFKKVQGSNNTPTPPPSGSTPKYTLTVKANNDQYGTVEGGGEYAENASATLKAIAKSGYEFKQWNDGNTAATRVVTVVADKTYTATFSLKQSEEEGTI